MSTISFDGIGEVVATFTCGADVKAGQVVKASGNGAVDKCGDGDRFCGVALTAEDGYAAVQVAGLVKVAAAEGVAVGWNKLLADGTGGVKKDSASPATVSAAPPSERGVTGSPSTSAEVTRVTTGTR